MKAEDNALLTRVEHDAPMGAVLRRYWHPVLRASRLEAGGAPVRTRLLGESFVAFKTPQGRLGFVDEYCPHRAASLALARNENEGLRCIFHGWVTDTDGKVVDVPTMPKDKACGFLKTIESSQYSVREAGGIIWVCLQPEGAAPDFPAFEFTGLDPAQVDFRIAVMRCNWVQGMESVLDSAHLGFLHRGQLLRSFTDALTAEGFKTNYGSASESTAPDLEIEERPYGFREAALRALPDGRIYAKIREFVAPYYAFLPGNPETRNRRILCASVPLDDETCAQWFIYYNLDGPPSAQELADRWEFATPDPDNFYENPGDAGNHWHQDRKAMKNGHFSGFPNRHIFHEDFIAQESMGPIVDRTRENLNLSDRVIVHTRRKLLESARGILQGHAPWGLDGATKIDYESVRSGALFLKKGEDWRAVDFHALAAQDSAGETVHDALAHHNPQVI